MGSQYCQTSDLQNAINPFALQDVTEPQQLQACLDASEIADSYMRGRYTLPLSQWGSDLVRNTARVAVYLLLSARGYQPDAGADSHWMRDYELSLQWFRDIQRQNVHPDVTPAVTQPGDPIHDLPQVISQPQRGWSTFSANGRPSVW